MYYESGLELYKQGEKEKAAELFQKALEHNEPEKVGASYYLAKCYEGRDEVKRFACLVNGLKYDETRPEICCEIGMYYTENQKYKEAIPYFLTAMNRRTSEMYHFFLEDYWLYIPRIQLCLCYDRLGDYQIAYQYNEMAACIYPNARAVVANREYFRKRMSVSNKDTIEAEKNEIRKRRSKYQQNDLPGVTIIAVTNRKKYLHNILENYEKMNYDKKEMVILLNANNINLQEVEALAKEDSTIRVFQLDEAVTLGQCLNFGVDHANYEYIAKMDDDDYYAPNYILDMMIECKETGIEVLAKAKIFIHFIAEDSLYLLNLWKEGCKISRGAGATIFAKKTILQECRFYSLNENEDGNFFMVCEQRKIAVFGANKFNYLCNRYPSLEEHTWTAKEEEIKGYSLLVDLDTDIMDIVTV